MATQGDRGSGCISNAKDSATATTDGLHNYSSGVASARGNGTTVVEGDAGTVVIADDRTAEVDCIASSRSGVEATTSDRLEDDATGIQSCSSDVTGVGEVDSSRATIAEATTPNADGGGGTADQGTTTTNRLNGEAW